MSLPDARDRIDLTILELARKLVQLELQRPALTRVDYLSASDVRQRIRGREHPPALDECMVSVLDYLVDRGLVVAMRDERTVTVYRAQRYRWSKHAGPEALERFARPERVLGAHGKVAKKERYA